MEINSNDGRWKMEERQMIKFAQASKCNQQKVYKYTSNLNPLE